MRSGLDNKRNVIVLAVLGVVMVGALVYFAKSMFGGSSPAPAPTQQTARTEPAAARQAGSRNEGGRDAEKLPPLEKLDPTLHPEVMAGAEALEYSGVGRNIFSLVSEPPKIEQVQGPIRPQPIAQPQIAQGPPPPPIDTLSLPRVALATVQPPSTGPTTSSSGTNTSSKKTSLNSEPPFGIRSGRTVTPLACMSMTTIVMPSCLGTSGFVRTVAKP